MLITGSTDHLTSSDEQLHVLLLSPRRLVLIRALQSTQTLCISNAESFYLIDYRRLSIGDCVGYHERKGSVILHEPMTVCAVIYLLDSSHSGTKWMLLIKTETSVDKRVLN